jgi:hypothetical protein
MPASAVVVPKLFTSPTTRAAASAAAGGTGVAGAGTLTAGPS